MGSLDLSTALLSSWDLVGDRSQGMSFVEEVNVVLLGHGFAHTGADCNRTNLASKSPWLPARPVLPSSWLPPL